VLHFSTGTDVSIGTNYTTLQQVNTLVPNGRSATSPYPNFKQCSSERFPNSGCTCPVIILKMQYEDRSPRKQDICSRWAENL